MSIPHRCPVCGGRGKMPRGFFDSVEGLPYSTSDLTPDQCRPCLGSGILWEFTPQQSSADVTIQELPQ
jgi:hypothetical protein